MIDYREQRPCAALHAHVECYWHMAGRGEAAPIERVLPDGCVELVLHFGDAFRRFLPAGTAHVQPHGFVVGPSMGFLLVQPGAHIDTLGVRLRPGAARAVLHVPVAEIAERSVPVDALLGAQGRNLLEVVGNARSESRRVRVLEAWLLHRLQLARGGHAPVHPCVRLALRHRGRLRVADLAQAASVTSRQLERVFRDEVGLGPKSLLRLARFQSVFGNLGQEATPDWADIALDCGYTDQAHLIRDFRSFSGETPASLLRAHGQLSRHFTSPERLRAFFSDDQE